MSDALLLPRPKISTSVHGSGRTSATRKVRCTRRVFVQSGDRVPADLRLVRIKGLQSQEGALTGELLPVEKQIDPVAADASLGDRASMAYSGTLITYGQGTGVVVATGTATEIGRISGLIAQVEPLTTPLLRQMARLPEGSPARS